MGQLYVVESRASRLNAMKDRMVDEASRQDKMAQRLERELKKVDRHLEVVAIAPAAANNPNFRKAVGVVPGRWHIVRRNPQGVDAWFPIMGPNGEFRDPELQVVEDMKAADLWRPGALKELRDRQMRQEIERVNREAREGEQRSDEARLAFRAAKRMPGDGGLVRSHAKKRNPGPSRLVLPAGVER